MRLATAMSGSLLLTILGSNLALQTRYLTKTIKKTNGLHLFEELQILWFSKVDSSIACALQCRSDRRCVSFAHDPEDGVCEGRGGATYSDHMYSAIFQGRYNQFRDRISEKHIATFILLCWILSVCSGVLGNSSSDMRGVLLLINARCVKNITSFEIGLAKQHITFLLIGGYLISSPYWSLKKQFYYDLKANLHNYILRGKAE